MSRRFLAVLIGSLLIGPMISPANALPYDQCQLALSPNQKVSLGFPISAERLVYKTSPRILIIPFRLTDAPEATFSENFRQDYLFASKKIYELSSGKSKIEFTFNKVVASKYSSADMLKLWQTAQAGIQERDLTRSTWGFVRTLISEHDAEIDFSNFDAVILDGLVGPIRSQLGEAMMFKPDSSDPWFESIVTAEGIISNVALLGLHLDRFSITHEILHLYGLTDLYQVAANSSIPSMMNNQFDYSSLLVYERWVLGWLPNQSVVCMNEPINSEASGLSQLVKFNLNQSDQIVIIRTGNETAYILESSMDAEKQTLIFYSIGNEERPPIKVQGKIALENLIVDKQVIYSPIGRTIVSPHYIVLVTQIDATSIWVYVVPKTEFDSPATNELIAQSLLAKAAADKATTDKLKTNAVPPKVLPKKKTQITCLKGKLIKTVAAINPKCPTGYKKK